VSVDDRAERPNAPADADVDHDCTGCDEALCAGDPDGGEHEATPA